VTGISAAKSLGARIAAARKARGYANPKEFARALEGSGITPAVVMNIESGRKADLTVSQALNIAWVLHLPVSALLAPMARPKDPLDLAGLIDGFPKMSAGEFDAWLCAIPGGEYVPASNDERAERTELQAYRELETLRRELDRLRVVQQLGSEDRPAQLAEAAARRIATAELEISKLEEFLTSAGWEL
jgi:hypothetical protein